MKVDKKSKETHYLLFVDLTGCCVDIKYLGLSVNPSKTNHSSGLWNVFITS